MTGIEETAANVAEQTKLMNEAGSAWNAVKKGDLEVCLLAQFPSHIEIRLPCDKKCRCGVPAHHKLAKSRVHRRCSILCAYRPSHSIICPCRHVPVAYSVPTDQCLQHPLSLQTITQHHLSLQTITQLFPAVGDVYQVGPVGENVFHIAMLLNTPSSLAIARYLATLYGTDLVNTPYQERKAVSDPPGLYEGETALHIAIVNHDLAMVKFLVAHGADVRAVRDEELHHCEVVVDDGDVERGLALVEARGVGDRLALLVGGVDEVGAVQRGEVARDGQAGGRVEQHCDVEHVLAHRAHLVHIADCREELRDGLQGQMMLRDGLQGQRMLQALVCRYRVCYRHMSAGTDDAV